MSAGRAPSDVNDPATVRVAVLGGGVGAMTTAFELTRPEYEGRYEVTVYQLGWRLGGKGASGRGQHGRIEEHGLHMWFGFYDNALRIMRECYDELGRGDDVAIHTFEDAFHAASRFGVAEERLDRWIDWVMTFPQNDEQPGVSQTTRANVTVSDYIVKLLGLCESLVLSLWTEGDPLRVVAVAPPTRADPGNFHATAIRSRPTASSLVQAAQVQVEGIEKAADALEIVLLASAAEIAASLETAVDWAGHRASALVSMLNHYLELLEDRVTATLGDTPASRRVLEVVDASLTIVCGLVEDGIVTHELGFGALDGYDLRDWMFLHGARTSTVEGGFLRGIYDLVFAYRDGNKNRPSFSAGEGLRGITRMFLEYKGAFAYRMQAGMGDVVFAPLYELLVRRGVRFEFFSEVTSVVPSADGERIDEVVIERQAHVVGDAPYAPLIEVRNLPCWPSEPLWDQLVDEGAGRARAFETPWPAPVRTGDQRRLRAGADFDHVVLALSLDPLATVCTALIEAKPAWRAMIDEVATVQTQALQIWLSASSGALDADPTSPVVTGYAEPYDTWADMSHLVGVEDWPSQGGPGSIHYFCSVLPGGPPDLSDPTAQARADATVAKNAEHFLCDLADHFLPGAVHMYPREFRWELLVGDGGAPSGRGRLGSQHLRANIAPAERYVLSLPGTTKHRLAPGDSGFDNLVLAGDWTRCGLSAGCVESAATSGIVAARAITKEPDDDVVGYGGP